MSHVKKCNADLLAALLVIRDKIESGHTPSMRGICEEVKIVVNCKFLLHLGPPLKCLMLSWPKYSGNIKYPIPSPKYVNPLEPDSVIQFTPKEIYTKHLIKERFPFVNPVLSFDNFYDGEYGKLRIELLEFCIKRLEKKLKARDKDMDIFRPLEKIISSFIGYSKAGKKTFYCKVIKINRMIILRYKIIGDLPHKGEIRELNHTWYCEDRLAVDYAKELIMDRASIMWGEK